MKFLFKGFVLGLLSLLLCSQAFAFEIKLPVTSVFTERDEFKIDLLKLLMEKAGEDCEITFSQKIYTQPRIIAELLNKRALINLAFMGTSARLEKTLLPVYFPVYRGLLGYRVFIIHKDQQVKFDNVKTLTDLQKFNGIQGLGWADIEILEHSGLKQYPTKYEKIFTNLNFMGRPIYFSRGVNEAFREVEARKDKMPNLAVEKKILLIYPFASFFFAAPPNQKLADALTKGFEAAYADGSLLEYFYNHKEIQDLVEQADIDNRVRINIPNPSFTKKAENINARYWHDPGE